MSVFENAIAGALASIRQVAGTTVQYSDGVHPPITLVDVGVGETVYELDDGNSVVETWTSRDYLVNAADLALADVPFLPATGHTITEVINGISKTFTLLAPPGKQVFEYSNRSQTAYRIHTQQTA